MVDKITVSAETAVDEIITSWHLAGDYPSVCDCSECRAPLPDGPGVTEITRVQSDEKAYVHDECAIRILARVLGH